MHTKKTISISLPLGMLERLALAAGASRRTASSIVLEALEKLLEKEEEK